MTTQVLEAWLAVWRTAQGPTVPDDVKGALRIELIELLVAIITPLEPAPARRR